MRILLVDDHADTAYVMSLLLRQKGHEVQVAMSVHQAISHLSEPFDLLVSDLGLPDGSGLEIMRTLTKQNKPIQGIALSGRDSPEDRESSKEAGFDEYLVKPVDLSTLLTAIERASKKTNN